MGTARLIVSIEGTTTQELTLSKDRITIGRRPHNDIVLDNPAISGEHAMIARSHSDCVLEDLGSTNGTYVNGQPVKKHFLQNNDVIELMKYRIKFVDALHAGTPDKPSESGMISTQTSSLPNRTGALEVLNGRSTGKKLVLSKDVATLGSPGVLLAAVIRQPDGYFIRHVEGFEVPRVNEHPISTDPFPLMDGDVINLSGTNILFSLI